LQHSSTSESSGSDWECSGAKQSSAHKPHFSVTSCDTGLKLKIAAIPRKSAKNNTNSSKRKTTDNTPKKGAIDRPAVKKKLKSQLSSSSSSESCSKCSSDSSTDDDLPLKAVSKSLQPKGSPLKTGKHAKSNTSIKSDSDEDKRSDSKDNVSKVNCKSSVAKTNNPAVKKTKSDEISNEVTVKRGRGRPRTKVSTVK
jgi:hypothetical protein